MTGLRILKIFGITLLTLIIVLLLLLWLFDFGVLKPKVESAVKDFTGREFQIKGDLSVKILPNPTVLIEDATLAGPEWSADPTMLNVGKAYAQVNLLSLLSDSIEINRVELKEVRILVESGPDEQVNWDIAPAEESPAEPEAETPASTDIPVSLDSLDIAGVTLIYRKPDTEDVQFTIQSASANRDEDGTSRFEGEGQYADLPLSVTGLVSDHHTELHASAGKVNIESKYDYPKDSVGFNVSVSTLSQVGSLLDIQNLPDESLSLEGSVSLKDNNIVLQDIVASLSGLRLAVHGKVDTGSGSIQLSTEASGEKLSYLEAGLPEIPFSVKSEISIADNVINLKPYKLTFGESDLDGNAEIKLSEDSPDIQLTAHSRLIDLSPFMGEESEETEKNEPEQPESGAGSPASGSQPSESPYVFTEDPLPLDSLKELDIEVNADIARLVMQNTEMRKVKTDLKAHDGKIDLTNTFEGKVSGTFDNKLTLSTSGDSADLDVSTKVRDVRIALLSGDSIAEDEIPVTNLNIDLKSSGSSARTIASALDGNVIMTQGAGKVSNDLIERFSGDIISQLFNALNPFSKQDEYTNWECSLFAIDFESGEGDIEGFMLQSEKLMVVGGGTIDLNDETLNIEFNTKPRTGVGISADMFVTPFVKLSGTLSSPSVGLNNKGVLLSGGAAVLTGGMSFLYTGLMDRATATADRCDEARSALKDAIKKQSQK